MWADTRPTVAGQASYADRLTAALEASDLSVREVAKRLSAKTGTAVEDERSAIYRYKRGEYEPEPDRAVMLALILEEPALAMVTPLGEKRRGRLAELEAEVARFREAQLSFAEEVLARLAALEAARGRGAQPSTPQASPGETAK
jgi:transcriptional regulator with XRE-family HTH domain